MKHLKLIIALLALFLCAILTASHGWLVGLVLLTLISCAINTPRGRLCLVTISVPEILKETLAAFKLETPELFGPAGFARDFKSNTAVLGDKVTARISHVPLTGAYDGNNGGFKAPSQDVTTLIEDVPVTLNQFRCVTVRLAFLSGLSSKVDLYKAAIGNLGFALGKYIIDTVLAEAAVGVSNSSLLNPALCNLDSFDDTLRGQANAQKMAQKTRWAFVNTALASALGQDDRVRSELFYGQKNGEQGFRIWKNLAGFQWVKEYPDIANAGNKLIGLMGDHRLAAVSVRKIQDTENIAEELGIPKVMEFYPIKDDEGSGLELTGVTWQEQGTGDTFLSVAILFGVGAGNQGGAAGSITDNAGCLIQTP